MRPGRWRAKPSRLTPSRQALLLVLCVVWFIPGLTGRSLWKPTETTLVPAAYESFADGASLVVTNLGEPLVGLPPGYLYLASKFGESLEAFLPYHEGMRVSNIVWLLAALALGGLFVGRRHGSRVGWRMVLLVLSSLGLLLHARTVNPDVALLFLGVAGVLGLSTLRDNEMAGGLALGLAGALSIWCVGPVAAWYMLALLLLPMGKIRKGLPGPRRPGVILALVLTALGLGSWLLSLNRVSPSLASALIEHMSSDLSLASMASSAQKVILSTAWVTWPALPFAAMSYVKWRYGSREDREVPEGLIALVAGFLALVLTGSDRDSVAILLIPAAAYMSVIGMQDLSKEVAKIHDKFAFVVIGGGMIGFFWLSWIAVKTGHPSGMVEWLRALGIEEGASGFPILFAILASLAWIGLMLRIGRSSERAMVNWVAGITVSWLLFTLLWMPEVDRIKGYGSLADGLREALPSDYGCVEYTNVDRNLAAQLAYLSGLKLVGRDEGEPCGWLLASSSEVRDEAAAWSGKRVGDLPSQGLSLYKVSVTDGDEEGKRG